MSHRLLQVGMMAPDSHAAMHNTTTSPSTSPLLQDTTTTTTTDPSALLTLMAIGPTPTPPPSSLPLTVPGGILSKGSSLKKRVSFRDSNLVSVREIPPRPRRVSSSEEDGEGNDEEDSDDDEEDSATSDSDDDSEDSDSEEEETVRGKGARRQIGTITGKSVTPSFRAVTRTRSSPSPATNSSLSSPRARFDRTHTSPANTSGVTSAKGSYHVTSSPTSRVVSLVSQITGVSSVATQTHIKQRKAAAATVSKPPAASTPKQVTAVLKVDKKVKKISPNMDGGVTTSQTVRPVQNKDGAPAVVSVGRVGQGKATRKKRGSQLLRRQDGTEKRKPVTLRKAKETKNTTKTCSSSSSSDNVNGAVPERVKCKLIVNGISTARDSLSLPPLGGGGEETPLPSKPLLPHTPTRIRTPIFSVDGFIFPGDLATGVKVKNATSKTEDPKLPFPVPKPAKERFNSAPPGSPGRRKRCHAWHMANGDLENNLQEPPSITPMWETVTPVGAASSPVLPSR